MDDALSLDSLDFAMMDAPTASAPRPTRNPADAFEVIRARVEAHQRAVSIVHDVKARGLVTIREFDVNGFAYLYLRDNRGWHRYSDRRYHRASAALSEAIWEAGKRGLEMAICPKMPTREVA